MDYQDIPIGTVVGIRKSSEYYGIDSNWNPADSPGIIEMREGPIYYVRWFHSDRVNSYWRNDLRYWRASMGKAKEEPLALADEGVWERAHKAVIDSGTDQTAKYAFVYTNGTYKVSENTACHYAVMSLEAAKKRRVAGIATCIHRSRKQDEKVVPREAMIWYYNWLFNQSPWASAFRDKDAESAYDKRTAVALTNVPANLLQGALVASRQPWEHPRVVNGAYTMSRYGVDPNLCFLLGSFLTDAGEGEFILSPHGGGHFPLDCYNMAVSDAKAFVENNPHELTEHYCKGGHSMAVHKMFKGGTGKRFDSLIREWLNKAGKEESTTTNPFAAAKPKKSKSVKAKDLATIAIKEQL